MKSEQKKVDYPINNESTKSNDFNVEVVCNALQNFNQDENSLKLDQYLIAFREIEKLFEKMGPIFTFVGSDVNSKIKILNNYLMDEKINQNYKDIQTMIEFERKENLLRDSKRPSGSRTLLRLHRALEFISLFLMKISQLNNNESINTVASNIYDKTLRNYHSWFVEKASKLALYTLPVRGVFIERLFSHERNDNEVNESMAKISQLTESAFKSTQKLYEKENLLDLP